MSPIRNFKNLTVCSVNYPCIKAGGFEPFPPPLTYIAIVRFSNPGGPVVDRKYFLFLFSILNLYIPGKGGGGGGG
jgi:hypothetical protein